MKKALAAGFAILLAVAVSSGNTKEISGVEIRTTDGNKICMSFEGEITRIIINGNTNFPGDNFDNITKIGDTKISRDKSGRVVKVGKIKIFRNESGNIIKIGDAEISRDRFGVVVSVNGDPYVNPLFKIEANE